MRYFSCLFLILCSCLVSASASIAQTNDTEIARPLTKNSRLDELFAQLKKVRNPGKASEITAKIWSEWNSSDSATINLIMQWAHDAMTKRDYAAALDFLDQATSLLPDYAESWNKRATLHYQMGNYKKSMADITRVLVLEPRHFGALSGMAVMLEETGRDKQALAVWRRLLEIYPADRTAQNRVKALSEQLAGDRT